MATDDDNPLTTSLLDDEEPAQPVDPEAAEEAALMEVTEQLRVFLANNRPAKVLIVERNGRKQPLALKTGRHRWNIAVRVIMRQLEDVDRVELLDKAGAVFDVWRVPDIGDPEERAREEAERKEAELNASLPAELKRTAMLAKLVEHQVERRVEQVLKYAAEKDALVMQLLKMNAGRLDGLERIFSRLLEQSYRVTMREAELQGLLRSGAVKVTGADGEAEDKDPSEAMLWAFLSQKLGVPLPGAAPQLPATPAAPTQSPAAAPAATPPLNGSNYQP